MGDPVISLIQKLIISFLDKVSSTIIEHLHSSIKFVKPEQRHTGLDVKY